MSRKHQFTKKDIGASVVFAGFDGGSYSATVTEVTSESVRVQYFPYTPINGFVPKPVYATVSRAEWARLTLFPADSKFLAIS